jgi:hypothetical protein
MAAQTQEGARRIKDDPRSKHFRDAMLAVSRNWRIEEMLISAAR